jgi:hypothetical protein
MCGDAINSLCVSAGRFALLATFRVVDSTIPQVNTILSRVRFLAPRTEFERDEGNRQHRVVRTGG